MIRERWAGVLEVLADVATDFAVGVACAAMMLVCVVAAGAVMWALLTLPWGFWALVALAGAYFL